MKIEKYPVLGNHAPWFPVRGISCHSFHTWHTHADLPLTIEDLIAGKGKIRLNLALNYANSEHQSISLVPTGSKFYISVPTKHNSDILIGSLSLGYGLTHNTEIYERGNYLYSNARTNSLGKISTALLIISNFRYV